MELRSGVARWFGGFLSRRAPAPLDRTRADLVVVVSGFDDVEACSTTLERGAAGVPAWTPDAQAVLRHHLRLPPDRVQEALTLAGQDDYELAGDVAVGEDGVATVLLERVQVLDALHCSQERSRMAGLAQRLGGTALGWEGLQPPPAV
ncbi:hypothetical protein ABEU20_000795 [Rhodococcus sp. PAM 2766]|uniref:Uncharacterized protein n=1 Tax=Rhodococcus parequi TaxID=3137122 RepID=A0ABW9F9P6_9NOCA